jgi:ATP-binding cassette subfamily C exporter for protease/lipase
VLGSRNELTLLMLTVMMLIAYLMTSGLDLIRSFVLVRRRPRHAAEQARVHRRVRAKPEGVGHCAGQSLAT